MPLAAKLGVLLSGSLGRASKLLVAADKGDAGTVSEILSAQPQLATFCGFHGTQSALHRAAAAGHLDACRAVLEPLKQRAAVAESLEASGRRKPGAAGRWRRLVSDVLDQRSSKGFTPLMLACRGGHALVAAYLLREGADPLQADVVNSRTALHYAASGGHVDCLRLLCGEGTLVATPHGPRRLTDVLCQDMTVQTCRYIDQRAYGGLTPLHFAVVTGKLEAVQALLQAGASIMVKTDGEAYLGEEYLVPGSTPLHIAVMIGSVGIVHALLQVHAELMNVVGQTVDERGRRPWEGHSRTDIRSMRNHFRKLPFHLARDRGATALAQLVDPRISVYVALDAARDTDQGIGPKRLQTIVAIVLQQQLLGWLDTCQQDMEAAAAAAQAKEESTPAPAANAAPRASARDEVTVVASTPASPMQAALAAIKTGLQRAPSGARRGSSGNGGGIAAIYEGEMAAAAEEGRRSGYATPSAAAALPLAAAVTPSAAIAVQAQHQQQQPPSPAPWVPGGGIGTQSAPTTPLRPTLGGQPGALPHASAPAPPALAAAQARPDRMPSLHGYVGLLSVRTSVGGRRSMSVEDLATLTALQRSRAGSPASAPRPSFDEQLPAGAQADTGGFVALARQLSSPPSFTVAGRLAAGEAGSSSGSPPMRSRFLSEQHAGPQLTVVSGGNGGRPGHRRTASASTAGGVRGVLTTLRDRLRTSENGAGGELASAPSAAGAAAAASAPLAELPLPGSFDKEPLSKGEKDLSEEEEGGSGGSQASAEDEAECGVCLDHGVQVAFAGCHHKLCISCARNLTAQARKPPHCPFCRKTVYAFTRLDTLPASRPATAVQVRAH